MKKTTLISIALITILFSVMSCKKKNDPEPVPAPTPTPTPTVLSINSDRQASFALDGVAISYVQSNADFYIGYGAGGSVGSGGSPTTREFDASIGLQNADKYLTIKKGTLTVLAGGYPSDVAFLAFFPAGIGSYAPPAVGTSNGTVVNYWDGTTQWSSDKGTADQTGSAFNYVATQNVANPYDYDVKFYATFNCKLYDGNGNSKTVTNGVFIGDFANL